jgi:hypothetical protein
MSEESSDGWEEQADPEPEEGEGDWGVYDDDDDDDDEEEDGGKAFWCLPRTTCCGLSLTAGAARIYK